MCESFIREGLTFDLSGEPKASPLEGTVSALVELKLCAT